MTSVVVDRLSVAFVGRRGDANERNPHGR